jgi:hypothetical protein
VEFPAQGYVNPANTFLSFDVELVEGVTAGIQNICFQNNIQSIFQRVRLLYGSNPLEDIINYNQVVRNLTEWTATAGNTIDQTTIGEGIGGICWAPDGSGTDIYQKKVRSSMIQAIDFSLEGNGYVPVRKGASTPFYTTRRYQIQFALGLFTQGKLIPTKFMASQLAIELSLAPTEQCIFSNLEASAYTVQPTYRVTNVNLIPEILEFDASYDASFIMGLQQGGVPIKFSSFHYFQFPIGTSVNALIQERSRSVKSLFSVVRRSPARLEGDSGATLLVSQPNATLHSYQYRIGGRYFPASPVQVSTSFGDITSNGGAEAFAELQKALNTVGDYRLSSAVNSNRWGYPCSRASSNTIPSGHELDYTSSTRFFQDGNMVIQDGLNAKACGNNGSACFTMAVSLETSNGMEISGLNAEEQSDISLQAQWSNNAWTNESYILEVYSYYDAMLVLRENNVIELIQ